MSAKNHHVPKNDEEPGKQPRPKREDGKHDGKLKVDAPFLDLMKAVAKDANKKNGKSKKNKKDQ